MYKLEKVNNKFIVPLISKNERKGVIRSTIFVDKPENITVMASRKGSGKTTVLGNVLMDHISTYPLQLDPPPEPTTYKPTIRILGRGKDIDNEPSYHRGLTILVFSGTLNTDKSWRAIIEILASSGVKYLLSESTFDENGNNYIDAIISFLKKLKTNDEQPDTNLIKDPLYKHLIPVSGPGDFILVIDDLAKELKTNTSINKLFKISRHLVKNIIISTQNTIDALPDMLESIDNLLIYRKTNIKRLKRIYELLSLDIPFEKFLDVYKQATENEHEFLFINVNNDRFYKGFNEMFPENL